MNLAQLYRLNSLKNFDTIEIGNEIVIGYEENTKNKKIISIENKTAKGITPENGYHIVKSGEAPYRISRKYSLSVDTLKKMNNISTNNIYIGQKINTLLILIIPS